LLLVGISVAILAYCRKCRFLPVAWLWYLGMLVPVSGLVQVGRQAMADRYTYLTQIGLYMAIAWSAACAVRAWPVCRWPVAAVSALVLASFMGCARQQAGYWRDSVTLWSHAVACTRQNGIAHNNLGIALARRGDLDRAIAQYETALEIMPTYSEAYNNRGLALARRRDFDQAIADYQTALKLKPDYSQARNNLAAAYVNRGLALAARGDLDRAIVDYQKALKIRPDNAAAVGNMAWIRATSADPKFRDGLQAVELARRAIELSSSNAITLSTLAAAYAEAGRFAEAVQTAGQALDFAKQENQAGLAAAMQARIRLYEGGKPYRESPSSPAAASVRP
jgi:Flp pilus assembly protein TadD